MCLSVGVSVQEGGCSVGVRGSACVCCGVCVCLGVTVCLAVGMSLWAGGCFAGGGGARASLCLCGVWGERAGRCVGAAVCAGVAGGRARGPAARARPRFPAHSGWADSRAEKKTRRQGNQSETNRFPSEVRKSRCCSCWWPVRL